MCTEFERRNKTVFVSRRHSHLCGKLERTDKKTRATNQWLFKIWTYLRQDQHKNILQSVKVKIM